jgi:nitrogen regulatory protein PII-like uncharacterized protein
MKNISKISVLFLLILLVGCKQEVEKPKVIYENSAKTKEQPKVDTTQLEIADLPVQMQGTNYLIHPIGNLTTSGGTSKIGYESSTNTNDVSFKISNHSENEITGYLRNLKFQEIGSDSIKALTNKVVLIQTATYLKAVSDKAKQQVLIYTLADSDTNKDGKLDANDIKSLYISEISGNRFTKISVDLQELIDWNLMESKSRVYFRTIEDTNKNGQFDKNDIVHYHYLDLSNKDWKVCDYSPI